MTPDTVARGQATTLPHPKPPAVKVARENPLPCYVILVHGVNDVGEAYSAQEKGLCWGLSERLGRNYDLQPFAYTLPSKQRDDALEATPDKKYYRRTPNTDSYSPVIPFYWGFREEDGLIKKNLWHGEWVDRCANRIDKDGAKNGGAFVNAANCLPHMWAEGWKPDLKVKVGNAIVGTPTHALSRAPYRSYQVLAALRLAMLIRIIRARHPEAAINVVAHSMGCLVALLAQTYLMDEKEGKPADTLVMNNPPYSFEENSLDAGLYKDLNQTSWARVETLKQIVQAFHEKRAKGLTWADLKKPEVGNGLAGPNWSPTRGTKKEKRSGNDIVFPERDNRGRITLYFSPEDRTVALLNTQGIGWQGIPDRYTAEWRGNTYQSGFSNESKTWPTLMQDLEASGFRQRIFLAQLRAGKSFMVGLPPQHVSIREGGDQNGRIWGEIARLFGAMKTQPQHTMRRINAEQLYPPIAFAPGPDVLPVSPIDAAVALAHGGTENILLEIDNPRPKEEWYDHPYDGYAWRDILNRGKPLAQQTPYVIQVVEIQDEQGRSSRLRVHRKETPDETRQRWQSKKMDENSHHSSIVSNHWHSQAVTAYDLALGRPIPWTEEEKKFYAYLCEVADWRIKTKNIKVEPTVKDKLTPLIATGFYPDKDPKNNELINATATYYVEGKLPPQVMAAKPADKLSLIRFETTGNRAPVAG